MRETQSSKLAGKLFLCMIGVMLLIVGGVFEWLMIRSYLHARESRAWPEVEAVVLRSEIEARQIMGYPQEVRFNILFEYDHKGQEITSESLSPRGSKWTKDEASVHQLAVDYQVGTVHTAWVNPDRPDKAILRHDSKAAGYTLWFPALIMIGGSGMIWGAFYRGKDITRQ